VDLFVEEGRGVGQRLPDVFWFEVGILADNSSADMLLAKRLTTSETVMRIPRIQARPPITVGSKVILSNIVRSRLAL